MSKQDIERLIREFVILEIEENPERKDNDITQVSDDSLDMAVDRTIASFDKSAKDADGQFDVQKFVTDMATMIDHVADQIDIPGTIVRRIANYVAKSYDEKTSKEVQQQLEDSFGISADPSFRQGDVDNREVPTAATGGPDIGTGAGGPPV